MTLRKDEKPRQSGTSRQSAQRSRQPIPKPGKGEATPEGIGSTEGQRGDDSTPDLKRDESRDTTASDIEKGSGSSLVHDSVGAYKERP
jgi:hypothetical protein